MERLKIFWDKIVRISPILLLALTLMGLHWAAISIHEDLSKIRLPEILGMSLWTIMFVAVFLGLLRFLYKIRAAFFRPLTRSLRAEKADKRSHLVIFLSNLWELNGESIKEGVPNLFKMTENVDTDLANWTLAKRKIKEEIKHSKSKDLNLEKKARQLTWSWEMPLRAIVHHLGKLVSVTIVCSPESFRQAGAFLTIVRHYPSLKEKPFSILGLEDNHPRLVRYDEFSASIMSGINFENFDKLSEALLYMILQMRKQRISENEIMIDFTGGTKVVSAIAAAITFNRKIKAQYVQTNDPWEVNSYDIIMGLAEPGGLEI